MLVTITIKEETKGFGGNDMGGWGETWVGIICKILLKTQKIKNLFLFVIYPYSKMRYSLSTEVSIPRKYLESVPECRIMVQAFFLFSKTHITDAFKTPSSSFPHKSYLLAHYDLSGSFLISALFQCSAEPMSASAPPGFYRWAADPDQLSIPTSQVLSKARRLLMGSALCAHILQNHSHKLL